MKSLFSNAIKYAVIGLAMGAAVVQPAVAQAMPMAQPAAQTSSDIIKARASWAGNGNPQVWRHHGNWHGGGRWNHGGRWDHGWRRGGHWRGGYYRHHDGWGPGAAIGLGLGLGALGALQYYDAPRYYAPRVYRGGNAHVRWCYARYRSYRAYDNTYQPYHGPRRQCVGPY